jgi:TrpR-related protein YerC/YecD
MLTCRLVNATTPGRPEWRDDDVDELLRAFGLLRSDEERAAFLRDLCTLAEIHAMSHRLAAARLVDKGVPYAEVAERVGGSTTTVTRVAHWLRHGEGGYRLVLDRLARRRK